jgi:hypothetical protein
MRRWVSVLAVLTAGCSPAIGAAVGADPSAGGSVSNWLYLPPGWAERVVFYDSFESSPGEPEVNRIQARLPQATGERAEGFVGQGFRTPCGPQHKAAFEIVSPALSIHRPLTVMCWWRLDAPMQETTGFNLLNLHGNGPYLPHFVAGKGPWCALKEPTFIYQVVNFPGIPQYHNSWGGRAWFEPGEWHHVAMTVANANEVRVYRDGQVCETILPKGRAFKEGEINAAVFGSQGHPMTIDEALVVDRALTPEELADYVLAACSLRGRAFPVGQVSVKLSGSRP